MNMKTQSRRQNLKTNTDTALPPVVPMLGGTQRTKGLRAALTVALLCPMTTAAMCATPPLVSKATYLEIAMNATAPEPPEPDCVTGGPPKARDFPTPKKVTITSPETDIQQGREYGETLITARDNHHYREGQIDAFSKTCRDGFAARQKRHTSQTETRQRLIDEMNKPDPKWWQVWK